MAAITTLHQAFLHDLSDIYDGEHQLLKAMEQMRRKAKHRRVKDGLKRHIAETREQVENLDNAFAALEAEPEKTTCKGAKGLIAEFRSAAKEMTRPELVDALIVDAGLKAEHYEIAAYGGLVEKAKLIGHDRAARLLEANLWMEEGFKQHLLDVEQVLGEQVLAKDEALLGHVA